MVARIASEKTLEKVDRFLDKHIKLDENVLKTLNIIDRAAARGKFLFSGIEGLRQRVKGNADHLSQCLSALTSVSVSYICDKLEKIHADCRNGVRARTVITAAVLDGERVNVDEVLEQVQKDLVDEDVHPEGIDLQFDVIRQWAKDVADSGGLSENEDEDTARWKDFERSGFAATGNMPTPVRKEKGISSPATDPEEDLYASSVAPRDTHLQPLPERGRSRLLQAPSERTLSRPSSMGSHRSQDSDWRPFPELSDDAQRYIHETLSKALSMELFSDLVEIETASTYFKRAFSQQDAYNRGYLTRNEATIIGKHAVQEAGIDISDREIKGIIDGYDDGNAKIDREEFLGIMHELRFLIHDELKQKWRRLFDDTNARAEQRAATQRLVSHDEGEFLHWGFLRESYVPDASYMDIVENKPLDSRPPVLPPWSFTVMAYEAANCVSVVDVAENEWWNKVLPDQHLRDQFHRTFTHIREIALRFALFENKNDRSQLSDLDEMVSVVRLLSQTEGTRNIAEHPMEALCQARGKAHALLREIVGFAFVLQADDGFGADSGLRRLGRPSTASLPNDLKRWKENHMESWAKLIGNKADEEWPVIETAALASRQWYEMRGSVASPLGNPKAKLHVKSKLRSEPDLQSLASTSHSSVPQNRLAESAMYVAAAHCRTIRTVEQADVEELRASPRSCRMGGFEVEDREVEKGRFSFPSRRKPPKALTYRSLLTYRSAQMCRDHHGGSARNR